jgi:uncharacterized membrane protein YcjF (UPF0283 family)
MKPFLAYTAARLGLFVVAYGLIWLIMSFWLDFTSITNLWVMLMALVLSSVVSIFALGRLRDRLAANVHARATRMSQRIEESRSAEDVD